VWSATTLAPSFSALEADVAAQLPPVRGIERSQLRADWHRYAVSWDHRRRRSAPAGVGVGKRRCTRRSIPATAESFNRTTEAARAGSGEGFILPAQSSLAAKPPVGDQWVHEADCPQAGRSGRAVVQARNRAHRPVPEDRRGSAQPTRRRCRARWRGRGLPTGWA
jgi:hypothetical protein